MLQEATPLRRDSWSVLVINSLLDRSLEPGVIVESFCIDSPLVLDLVFMTDWLDSRLGLHLRMQDSVPDYFQFDIDVQSLGDIEPNSFALYLIELAVREPDARIVAIPTDQRGIRWCRVGFRDQ
jgi:hypothetical protein